MDRPPAVIDRLAAFALTETPFSSEVLTFGRRMIVDQVACQVAGAVLPWSRAYRDAIRDLGSGSGATVVYYGDALAVDQAAFVNSSFGHAAEFDDTHLPSATHPGSAIVPAVLTFAEHRHASGRAALEAVIVGAEILLRIAWTAAPYLHERGHHAATASGPFGVAAAVSRLLAFDPARCVQAMAISGSHSAGLLEFNRGGGSVKRIHGAIPAMAGIRSAVMAAHGITGPVSVLDGPKGFFNVFAGRYDLTRLCADLGQHFLIGEISFKPVACNYSTHASLEAIAALQDEHRFEAGDVASIDIGAAKSTIEAVGGIVLPHDVLGAQSSYAFSAAVRLLRGGNGLDDFRQEDLDDPRFVALAQRVRTHVDPQCEEEQHTLRNRAAVVTIELRDGRRLERRVRYSKGTPQNPMSDVDLSAKFLRAVTPRLGADRAAELLERLWTIDDVGDAGEVVALTRALARS